VVGAAKEKIMNYTEQQLDNAMTEWMRKHRVSGDDKTNAAILRRTIDNLEVLGGYPSPSAFERSYLELISEKAIKPFRGTVTEHVAAGAPALPQDVVEYIQNPRTSALEMNRRYRSDSTFRAQYDLWEKTKNKKQVQQSAGVSLTAEEYHRIPSREIAQKYQRDYPIGFRAAIDKLIKEGKI
jgi:hypothetical protein